MSKINVSQICFSNPKESNNYSQLYLANPEKRFLEKFGRLAILIDLNFKREASDEIITQAKEWSQALIDFIKGNFYHPTRSGQDIEKEFEDILQKTNNWLQKQKIQEKEFFEKYITNYDIDIINIFKNKVHFSQAGQIKAYLISNGQKQELAKENKETEFLNVISGSLEENNILLFATNNLFDYFPDKKIIQLLKELPVDKAMNEIKQLLSNKTEQINLLALVVSHRDESLISSSEKIEPKQKVQVEPQEIKEAEIDRPLDMNKQPNQPEIKIKQKNPFLKSLELKNKIKAISGRKIIVIFLIILAIFFIQSLISLGREEFKTQQTEKYDQIIANLKTKESELSIALIYGDPDKIKKLFAETKQLLEQIPQKNEEQKTSTQLFYNRYFEQLNKFYRLSVIDNLEPLIDLSSIDKKALTGGLVNIGDDFYIFNPENNYIYLYNISSQEAKIVNNTSANVGRIIQLFPLDNDNLIGYDQNQELLTFNTIDQKLLPLKLETAYSSKKINDLFAYGRYLYLLDSLNNQIYKYTKTIDGFGKEEPWIQGSPNLSNALAFTIDGSIYVFKKTGQISKFYKNTPAEFNLDDIEPALSVQDPNILNYQNKIKLFTDSDRRYLYLLDGASQRLIILSKEGKLVKQLMFPQLKDLKGFVISQREDRAWLLDSTSIFEINLK